MKLELLLKSFGRYIYKRFNVINIFLESDSVKLKYILYLKNTLYFSLYVECYSKYLIDV